MKKPTKRQIELIYMIAKGLNENQIGVRLGMTKRTVSTYKNRLFKKLEVKNMMQIVIFSLKKGIIKLENIE